MILELSADMLIALRMLRNHATPRTDGGYTILIITDSEITIADYDNAQTLLGAESRAGNLTCQVHSRFALINWRIMVDQRSCIHHLLQKNV